MGIPAGPNPNPSGFYSNIFPHFCKGDISLAEHPGKNNTRRGVLICGAYGMHNGGDEAILEAVVGEMRAIDPEMPITVLTRTPAETAAAFGVNTLHTFDVPGFSFPLIVPYVLCTRDIQMSGTIVRKAKAEEVKE